MSAKVIVIGPRDKRPSKGSVVVNTTSRSNDFGRGLSPFFLGPVPLYEGHESKNVENAWQYSKVYEQHVGKDGMPNDTWALWAFRGWRKEKADRYPMGKGAVPEYSYWDGERLSYTEARRRIYIPLYARAVKRTEEFEELRRLYRELDVLYLWDFDGYDHRAKGLTLLEVMNRPDLKMGHGFVLAMMLQFGRNFYLK